MRTDEKYTHIKLKKSDEERKQRLVRRAMRKVKKTYRGTTTKQRIVGINQEGETVAQPKEPVQTRYRVS